MDFQLPLNHYSPNKGRQWDLVLVAWYRRSLLLSFQTCFRSFPRQPNFIRCMFFSVLLTFLQHKHSILHLSVPTLDQSFSIDCSLQCVR